MWWEVGGWGFVLGGDHGLGKTYACASLLASLDFGTFATAEEIASPEGSELIGRAKSTRLLVLDEMGAEALYDAGAARLHALIADRYAHERRTLITTNLNLEAWGARYGARLVDRFRRGDGGKWKEYAGESLRAVQAP
jgi:DNA replication protein DnaC